MKTLKAKKTLQLFGTKFKTECVITQKQHTYICGTKGKSIDTITYTVKLPTNQAWQPHSTLDKDLLHFLNNVIENEFEAYADMCLDD